MGKKKKKSRVLPLTIEERLKLYSEQNGHDERHEILWHAWNQNKRWLSQLLQMTMMSFPTYSLHNDSHAKTVLYNIEKVLGQERIEALSPTDCFMLLHVAYVHDIGMCITADDKEKMFRSDEFIYLLENLKEYGDSDMKMAANNFMKELRVHNGNLDDGHIFEMIKEDVYDRFDVYQAVIYLMQEAQRGQHGIKSEQNIIDWTMNQEKLGTAFSMSGIPLRIFVWIARCAGLHTDWEFEHIMDLPMEDSGYAHDAIHPRFTAVMLQIGDALDLDNGRFHMFTKMVMGDLPMQSKAHYSKHQSIRQLQITPSEIMIMANCDSQNALRLIRGECDNLEKLLQHASYYWSQITPEKMGGCLPTMKNPKLMLNGKEIPKELVTSKFEISQSKAFRLLQGENVYQGKYPFMRELIQNAIDATKLQCWKEYQASAMGERRFGLGTEDNISLPEFSQKINPSHYPIEIEMSYGYMDGEQCFHLIEKETKTMPENAGVYISIKDYGTGITQKDIANIASVGTSYQNRRKILREMPEWLRPTGEFGIGLQSVFLYTESFRCLTYCRNGESYRIEYNDRSNGGNGYINVEPIDPDKNKLTFGTVFQVFVSYKKKIEHEQFMSAWEGKDAFSIDYSLSRAKRHSIELMKQIIIDVDRQIGEPLFPIYFHINRANIDMNGIDKWEEEIKNVVVDTTLNREKLDSKNLMKHTSWLYKKDVKLNYWVYPLNKGLCALDIENMKIYLWIADISCAVKLGAKRIFTKLVQGEKNNKSVKIYYKGIYVDELEVINDAGLIEYIDLKGSLKREFIQLSRNGFTEQGRQFIKKLIEESVLPSLKRALDIIAKEKDGKISQGVESRKELTDEHIQDRKIAKIMSDSELISVAEIEKNGIHILNRIWEKWLGCIVFSYFYELYQGMGKRKILVRKNIFWDELLKAVEQKASEKCHELKANGYGVVLPSFLNIIYFQITNEAIIKNNSISEVERKMKINKCDNEKSTNLAYFMREKRKIMIISKRDYFGDFWKHYLLKLDKNDQVYTKLLAYNVDSDEDSKNYQSWYEAVMRLIDELESKNNENAIASYQQQILLSWMMKTVTTVAAYCSTDGNMRINVLGNQIRSYIFRDNNMIYLMLENMAEKYRKYGAMRFAVPAWRKIPGVSFSDIPKSVCCVNYGYLKLDYCLWTIMPFTGEQLSELIYALKIKNYEELNEEFQKIKDLFEIIEYLKDLEQEKSDEEEKDEKEEELKYIWLEYKNKFPDDSSGFVNIKQLFNIYMKELLEEEVLYENESSREIYLPNKTDLYLELIKKINHNDEEPVNNMKQFANALYNFRKKVDSALNSKKDEKLDELIESCKNDDNNRRLFRFIAEKSNTEVEEVKIIYKNLTDDIVELIKLHEKEKLNLLLEQTSLWGE